MKERRFARKLEAVSGAVATAILACGCPSLDDIPLGECGNGVVEPDAGEECDAAPEAETSRREGGRYCAGPNEVAACHWLWDDVTCCPDHFGAGLDGVCRAPSGEFETTPFFRIDEPALGFSNVDVDADGYRDLAIRYLSREIEVRFLGPSADPTPVRDAKPSEPGARATFGSLTAPVDPALDVCERPTAFASTAAFIPSDVGVRVLIGGPGGLLPKAFPAFDTPAAAIPLALPSGICEEDALPEPTTPGVLSCAGALAESDGILALLSIDLVDDFTPGGTGEPVLRAAFPDLEVADVGRLHTRIALPDWPGCDGFAVSFGAGAGEWADQVVVLGLCTGAAGDGPADVQELARIGVGEGQPFVLDVNGDGADDVVVATGVQLRVYLGDGAGAFGEDDEPSYELVSYGEVLGVARLDDDTLVQVGSGGILVGSCLFGSSCSPQLVAAYGNELTLVSATLADVNGDGRPDVVGGTSDKATGAPALAVFLSGESGVYSLDQRPTRSLPRFFVPGDFDGDGLDDVGMIVPASAEPGIAKAPPCTEFDDVQILFGNHGAPTDAVTVAQIAGVQAVASGLIQRANVNLDGFFDMGVTRTCVDPETQATKHEATILFGNGARGLDSPYLLLDGAKQERHLFASGRILGGDQHPDLVAIGSRAGEAQTLGLWAVPSTGAAELPASGVPQDQVEERAKRTPFDTGLDGRGTESVAVGDLDCGPGADATRCASDEIVVFQSTEKATDASSIDEPRITVFAATDDRLGFVSTSGPCPEIAGSGAFIDSKPDLFDDVPPTFEQTAIADVDGDGYPDVVAWWFGYDPETLATEAGDAYVFWNGPAGFAGTCPTRIAVPPGQFIRSIVPFVTADDTRAVAITVIEGIHILTLEEGRDLSACGDPASDRCRLMPELAPLDFADFVDFDHDGLEDLIASHAGGIEVYRQRPRDEVRAEAAAAAKSKAEDD